MKQKLIKWLGGYTLIEKCKAYNDGFRHAKTERLDIEHKRMIYLDTESHNGRMVNKIHNELVNVRNEQLRFEAENG